MQRTHTKGEVRLTISGGIGDGWATLARELQRELSRLDPPPERVVASIDLIGLLKFTVHGDRASRKRAKALVGKYESLAFGRCERCGEPGSARAGVIVTIRCAGCAGP
jgi:hypothetical protein